MDKATCCASFRRRHLLLPLTLLESQARTPWTAPLCRYWNIAGYKASKLHKRVLMNLQIPIRNTPKNRTTGRKAGGNIFSMKAIFVQVGSNNRYYPPISLTNKLSGCARSFPRVCNKPGWQVLAFTHC